MTTFEGGAVQEALAAYSAMSADLMASISEQSLAEATLTDLRAKAAADAAALGIVRGLIAELPRAETANHTTSFRLSAVEDVPKVRGSVIWGPSIRQGSLDFYSFYGSNTPYYLIGSRPKAGTNPEMAELLLAPAVTKPTAPKKTDETLPFPGLVVATTWTEELNSVEAAMAAITHTRISTEETERLFDHATSNLRVYRGGGVLLSGGKEYRSPRKIRKARERIQNELSHGHGVSLPASSHYSHSRVDFAHGLPYEERTDFSVFPRLVHLATLFGKTEILRELVETLHDEDRDSTFEALTAE